MPKFLMEVSYTAEGAAGVRKDGGTKRKAVAQKAAKSVGGKLESFYFSFGDTDAVLIVDLPDATSAAAIGLNLASSGAAHTRTTLLLTPEDIDKASGKKITYTPPGE